jgi:fibronectin type 3 domain-containing protein
MKRTSIFFPLGILVICLVLSFFASADVPKNGPNVTNLNINDSDLDGNIELQWNTSAQADRYLIFRSSANISDLSHVNVSKIGNTTRTFFEDNTSIHNVTYFYAIQPMNDTNGKNSTAFTSNLTSRPNDTYVPKFPVFTLTVLDHENIRLNWEKINQDNASNVETNVTYFIFRNSTFRINASSLASAIFNTTDINFTDTGLNGSTRYRYLVTSRDDAANHNTGINGTY